MTDVVFILRACGSWRIEGHYKSFSVLLKLQATRHAGMCRCSYG